MYTHTPIKDYTTHARFRSLPHLNLPCPSRHHPLLPSPTLGVVTASKKSVVKAAAGSGSEESAVETVVPGSEEPVVEAAGVE
jgi:hypothetical protein